MDRPSPSPQSRPIFIPEIEEFGGAERSALALASWLYGNRVPCHIVTYNNVCRIAEHARHPLPVVELKASGPFRRVAALSRYIRSRPNGASRPLLSGYQAVIHATLGGLKGFHTLMHDTPSLFGDEAAPPMSKRLRRTISNRIVGRGLKSGGNTIVTSEYLRAECRDLFSIDAHIVRMGGLADAPGNLRFHPVEDELRLLSVCRIEPNKRIDWILRALAELEHDPSPLSSRIDWRLDLAGRGSLIAELTQLATSLGIGDRVHFHGFVSDSELQNFYTQAHLFLMPALQGYGIPAIESLQRGIPVLLHRESGVSDILLDTPWATVMNGGQQFMTGALASAIDKVLNRVHQGVAQPHLPTEEAWARRVAELCGWI